MGAVSEEVVIGIDGGGTHTRVMVSDLTGRVLAYVERGSASLHKDLDAQQNVKLAIEEGLASARRELHHVQGLAAGIAGYDSDSDLDGVESLTAVPGLECPRWHVNDAVAAHYGALLMQPGIVAISGTGSIVVAFTEDGRYLRNFDFHHYAPSAARFIAYDAVYEALAGRVDASDAGLIEAMLQHWEAESLDALYRIGKAGFEADRRERDRRFGQFAPMLTDAAMQGSRLARRVCDQAIQKLVTGIQLLGASFAQEQGVVPVSFIGSVINSAYVSGQLKMLLASSSSNRRYAVTEPRYSPATGAVLLALHRLGLPISEAVTANLDGSPFTRT